MFGLIITIVIIAAIWFANDKFIDQPWNNLIKFVLVVWGIFVAVNLLYFISGATPFWGSSPYYHY